MKTFNSSFIFLTVEQYDEHGNVLDGPIAVERTEGGYPHDHARTKQEELSDLQVNPFDPHDMGMYSNNAPQSRQKEDIRHGTINPPNPESVLQIGTDPDITNPNEHINSLLEASSKTNDRGGHLPLRQSIDDHYHSNPTNHYRTNRHHHDYDFGRRHYNHRDMSYSRDYGGHRYFRTFFFLLFLCINGGGNKGLVSAVSLVS